MTSQASPIMSGFVTLSKSEASSSDITKNRSVAGRPRGVALSQEYTSAAGVAGQLQPLVRSSDCA